MYPSGSPVLGFGEGRVSGIDDPDSDEARKARHQVSGKVRAVEDVLGALVRKEASADGVGGDKRLEFAYVRVVPVGKALRNGLKPFLVPDDDRGLVKLRFQYPEEARVRRGRQSREEER